MKMNTKHSGSFKDEKEVIFLRRDVWDFRSLPPLYLYKVGFPIAKTHGAPPLITTHTRKHSSSPVSKCFRKVI